MHVVLIRPPTESASLAFPGGPRFGVPLGLLYLAAVCERAGHRVSVYDALVDFEWQDLRHNERGAWHIGAGWERVRERMGALDPDFVGITNPFSDFAHLARSCAQAVRTALPEVPIAVGGPHATVSPEYFLEPGTGIDYVVQGEGEETLCALLSALSERTDPSTVPGLCTRGDHGITATPHGPFITDLDSLPLPAYHLVDMERYVALAADGFPSRFGFHYPGSERECSLITSRGCPFRCVFCGNHLHMGFRWRAHSAAYVLRHMKLLVEQYGVKHFHLEDDNITLDPGRFESILDGILGEGWGITWDTPNGVRAEGLSAPLVRKARDSGCTYLVVGVESGNQEVLNTIVRKRLDLAEVERSLQTCRRQRLDTHAFYIVGFPGETRTQMRATFAHALRMLWRFDTMPHLGLARPLPGTELHELSARLGYLTRPVRPDIGTGLRGEVFERVMISTPEFSPEQLQRWVRRFNHRVMAVALLKIASWLLCHPAAWGRIAQQVRQASRFRFPALCARLFFGGLFYKFNYERPRAPA